MNFLFLRIIVRFNSIFIGIYPMNIPFDSF